MYNGGKMVDYAVNKNSQGIAIARPAAQLPSKDSGFTVQRTTQRHNVDQQFTLSGRSTAPDRPNSSAVVTPEHSGDAASNRGFPGTGGRGRNDINAPPFAATGNLRNPTEFSPIQQDKRGQNKQVMDDYFTSNHGSVMGSIQDHAERVAFVEKRDSSPVVSNMPNFTGLGSPPNPPRGDFPEAVVKMSSGSAAEDPQFGQPSYQRYAPGSLQVKASGSLAGKKGGLQKRTELAVGKGRFIMKNQIGAGSFGEIFWGIDTVSNKEVAIKLESVKVRHPQLQYESRIYKLLHNKETNFHPSITRYNKNAFRTNNKIVPTRGGALVESLRAGMGQPDDTPHSGRRQNFYPATFQELREVVGFPRCYFYGTEGEYNVMVMDLLGPNLEDLFNYCHRRFTLKTVCLIADQMLHRIEYLHHKGFIHRDLKPENFVMGGDEEHAHILHLIDYGLSKRYLDPRTNLHVTYKEGKSLTGTARYCSINAHLGIEQSRRDDIEALGYIILYFLKRGFLPWQGIRGAPDAQTKNVRISEKKINTRLEVLCRDEPPQIFKFMTYARGLKFEETPDYTSCREFFASLIDRHNWDRDWVFDWVLRRQSERNHSQQPSPVQPLSSDNMNNGGVLNNRLPMQNNPGLGAFPMEGSPNGFSDLEARNSSNHNQYGGGLVSPTELSGMLSTVDERDFAVGVHHPQLASPVQPVPSSHQQQSAQQHNSGRMVEPMRSNKVHMQPADLPGDMEYML